MQLAWIHADYHNILNYENLYRPNGQDELNMVRIEVVQLVKLCHLRPTRHLYHDVQIETNFDL